MFGCWYVMSNPKPSPIAQCHCGLCGNQPLGRPASKLEHARSTLCTKKLHLEGTVQFGYRSDCGPYFLSMASLIILHMAS